MSLIDQPETTVVTGSTGWLGTALMHAFTSPSHRWYRTGVIRALVTDRVAAERLRSLGEQVEPVVGDVRDPSSLDRLFADQTVTDVVHTAGVIHPRSVQEFFDINTEGTRNVLERSERAGVRRFVHVSSNSPFGTNSHPDDRFRRDEPFRPYLGYGESKMDAELAVGEAVASGLNAVIVRPPWFYGPHQPPRQTTFFTMVRRGMFPVFGGGQQRRSMVYVENLVDGVCLAELTPTPPGRAWWVADAVPYTVAEIVETVGSALRDEGYEVRSHRFAVPDVVGAVAERIDRVLQSTGRYHQQLHVLGEMNKNIACSIDDTIAELGYSPAVGLYDGMRTSIRWCRDQGIEL